MFTLATVVLVCLVITSQVEASSYYGRQFNDLLSNVKMQTVETALIMKLLHLDDMAHMQARECNPANKKKGNVLTEDNLKAVMNIFTHQSGNYKTFIYVPASETGGKGKEFLFNSKGDQSGTNHAEDEMKKALAPHLPQEFWITNTQCPTCARHLIDWYKNIDQKPVIRAVRFYSLLPSGHAEKEQAVECLAKMIYNGFQFLLWDWNKFSKDFLVTDPCKKLVTDALHDHGNSLKAEQQELIAALLKASNYADEMSRGEISPDEVCIP